MLRRFDADVQLDVNTAAAAHVYVNADPGSSNRSS